LERTGLLFGERLRGLILNMYNIALQNCDLLKRRPPAGRFAWN
jgi:hypothetical protein